MKIRHDNTTKFLNVDLDIVAKSDLKPLAEALGKRVQVLYVGREGRSYGLHLETLARSHSADAKIQKFASLIEGLPPSKRKLWDGARSRDFNIGVQAATLPHAYELALAETSIQTVSSLNARIVFTVYAPEVKTIRKAK
jgi:hypothetical protein